MRIFKHASIYRIIEESMDRVEVTKMSALLTQEELYHFENMIYLPMLLTILHKDRELVESGAFKLKAPYQNLIDQAVKCVEMDAKETRLYMQQHNLKLTKGDKDDFATQYIFHHKGYQEKRRYMNLRLRNRTEELLSVYLAKATSTNG